MPWHWGLQIGDWNLLPVSSFRVCWEPLEALLEHPSSASPAWLVPSSDSVVSPSLKGPALACLEALLMFQRG